MPQNNKDTPRSDAIYSSFFSPASESLRYPCAPETSPVTKRERKPSQLIYSVYSPYPSPESSLVNIGVVITPIAFAAQLTAK